MTRVRFAPEVLDELAEAALWYDAEKQGLGIEFLQIAEKLGRWQCRLVSFPHAGWGGDPRHA